MLNFARNTLLGAIGFSLISLSVMPAHADGWRKHRHHSHGPKVVKVVKKTVYVERGHSRRHSRRHHRAERRWDRRWERRQVRRAHRRWERRQARHHNHRWNRHHHTRVVHHNTTIVRKPAYRRGNSATAGTIIGAVLGGLTGNAIVRGRGRAPAIIAGGVLGAIIGGSIGDSMDKADHLHTQNALETARSGQKVTWTNPDSGADYTVTPTRTYQRENGQYCRDFKSWGWIDGYEEELHGTACRASDGTWRKVS